MRKQIEALVNYVIREFGADHGCRAWPPEEILRAAGVEAHSPTADARFANELWQHALQAMRTGYFYPYPKADHTVDAVILDDRDIARYGGLLKVLLIKRGREGEPFYNCWALPGGYMNIGETLMEALGREVHEEVGLTIHPKDWDLVGNFDAPDRDPRGRVISTAFVTFVTDDTDIPKAADDAKECQWFSVDELPPMAFDHGDIIHSAMEKAGVL